MLFFVPYAFCSARLFLTHAAGRAKKTLRARFLFFVRHAAGRAKKNTRGGWVFVFVRDAPGHSPLAAGGRLFLFVRDAAGRAKKNSGGAFLFFFVRDAPGHSLTCGPGGAFLFLFGTRLAEQNKTLRERAFLSGTRPVAHSLAGRGSWGPSFRGAFFFCSGRGWPSKTKEK